MQPYPHELVNGEYTAGAPIILRINLARDLDEDDESDQTVVAPFYPLKRLANWWLVQVVGDAVSCQLLVIKVTVTSLAIKLEFLLPKGVKLYVICDSHMGADYDIALRRWTVTRMGSSFNYC